MNMIEINLLDTTVLKKNIELWSQTPQNQVCIPPNQDIDFFFQTNNVRKT